MIFFISKCIFFAWKDTFRIERHISYYNIILF